MKNACLAGLCACGAEGTATPQTDAPKPVTMPQKRIATLLPQLAKGDREYAKRILKSCADSHYEDVKMQSTVDRYRGKSDEFLAFLRKEWGWIIDYDRKSPSAVAAPCVSMIAGARQRPGTELVSLGSHEN